MTKVTTNLNNSSRIEALIKSFDFIDIKKPIRSIIEKTSKALGSESCSIALIENDRFLRFINSLDNKPDDWLIYIRKGIIGQAIIKKSAIFVNEASKSKYFDPEIDLRTKIKTRSVLAAPLTVGKNIIGAIEVINKRQGEFTNYDAHILTLISQRSSYIIRNAKLFHDVRMQNARWEAVFRQSGYGKALLDRHFHFISINKVFGELVGYREKEVMGRFFYDYIIFIDSKGEILGRDDLLKTIKKGKNFNGEVVLRSKDKKEIWVRLNVSPIIDSKGQVKNIILNVQDISREKEIDLEKEDFITSVTHELRTPLTAVKGYLSMVLNNRKILKDQGQKYLKRAYVASEEIVGLVENLLEVIRMDDTEESLRIKNVDCAEIVEEVLGILDFKLKAKGIIVEKNYTNKHFFVSSDHKRLKIIISSIIDNAIKYSSDNKPIKIYLARAGKTIEIRISDTGIGLSKEHLEKVFKKSYRVENMMTKQISGFGLGLYIVQKLIVAIGGSFSLRSAKGRGTTFIIKIPITAQLPLLNIK